jgi:hypothetical protein
LDELMRDVPPNRLPDTPQHEGYGDDRVRARIEEALADPRPTEAAETVFAALRAHHADCNRAEGL